MAITEFTTKFCKKCNAVTLRYKSSECKPCSNARSNARNAAYRANNSDAIEKKRIDAALRRVERTAERAAAKSKVCTKCSREKAITEFRSQKKRNNIPLACCKECESEQQKKYRENNPEKRAETVRRSAQKNKEKIYKKNLAYRLANVDSYRVYTRNRKAKQKASGVLSKNIVKRLFSLQKGKCACCKLPLGDDYHLDHIMPLALGGTNTDNNVQLLRATCNVQKNAKHPIDFMQQRGFLL